MYSPDGQSARRFCPWNSLLTARNATTQTTNDTAKSTIAAIPSRPPIQAIASAPHVNAKIATIINWTTHVDIRRIVV